MVSTTFTYLSWVRHDKYFDVVVDTFHVASTFLNFPDLFFRFDSFYLFYLLFFVCFYLLFQKNRGGWDCNIETPIGSLIGVPSAVPLESHWTQLSCVTGEVCSIVFMTDEEKVHRACFFWTGNTGNLGPKIDGFGTC